MIKYTLTNGIRVVQEQIPYFRSVSFGIWVKAGSRYENKSNNGISHLIEHMLFKGTSKYSAKAIAEIFDRIGGNVNAFTAKEYTCFYAKVLDEHLPIAVEVLADMFMNSVLSEEEMEKEKNVVLEEISMYNDTPDDYVHDLASLAAYGNHPLAYSILGEEHVLKQMKPIDLMNYMAEFYHNDHIVISLAGNFTEQVSTLLEKHFGHYKVKGIEAKPQPPQFLGLQKFHEKDTEQDHICISYPGYSLKDEQLYDMVLLNNIVGGGMSSRLFQEIRENRGLAYAVYSYHSAYEDSGLFTIYTGTAPNQTEEVLTVMMNIIEDIRTNGLTDHELKNGKEQLKGNLLLHLEGTSSRMNRIGKNELMLKQHKHVEEIITRIEQIKLEDIQQIAGEIFQHPFAIAMVGKSDKVLANIRRV